MKVQATPAIRQPAAKSSVAAGGGETTEMLGALPDRFEASYQSYPGYPSYPNYPNYPSYPNYPNPGCPPYPSPPPVDGHRNFFERLFDIIFGHSNGGYDDPYYGGYPVDNGGYIPPEPAYGGQMDGVLNRYDQEQASLYEAKRRGMPDGQYARLERNLWSRTCDEIVRSWSSRDEKLGALGHVLNSSSMHYDDFQRYARMVDGRY